MHFRPPWWARNAHVQTLVSALSRTPEPQITEHERFELPDGDFIQLSWAQRPAPGRPLLVLLHGLEGGLGSAYIRRMLAACRAADQAVVVHHHRGCGADQNRLPRAYHSGDSGDIALVLQALRQRYPGHPLWAVGYSLGGNVICKYLGERGADTPLERAASVSAPLELQACADRMRRGFSRVYQRKLVTELHEKTQRKLDHPQLGPQMPFDAAQLAAARTFWQFDDLVTAGLHGFAGAQDYYDRASGRQYLRSVERPLLVLHAADDPFMTEAVIPEPADLSPAVTFELWPRGGHVGFIEGGTPWRPRHYLERRLLAWFSATDPAAGPGSS